MKPSEANRDERIAEVGKRMLAAARGAWNKNPAAVEPGGAEIE
ncbi:hypothetical protein GPNCGGLF_LOCUS4928 [Methylorubrum aminovorans]